MQHLRPHPIAADKQIDVAVQRVAFEPLTHHRRAHQSPCAYRSARRTRRPSRAGPATSSQQLRGGIHVEAFHAYAVGGHDQDRRGVGRSRRRRHDLHFVKPLAPLRRSRPPVQTPGRNTERRRHITQTLTLALSGAPVFDRLVLQVFRERP
jgi:hypothetical protein